MNTVMRTLTSVSIIMMLPTLISSLFGMNLVNGMEDNPLGFPISIAHVIHSIWSFMVVSTT